MSIRECVRVWANVQPCFSIISSVTNTFYTVWLFLWGADVFVFQHSLHFIKFSVLFMYHSVFPRSCSHLLCCSHATRSWINAWGYDCESAALTPMARGNHPNTKTCKPKLGKAIRSGHRTQELTGRMERGGVHNTQDIVLYSCFEMYFIHR